MFILYQKKRQYLNQSLLLINICAVLNLLLTRLPDKYLRLKSSDRVFKSKGLPAKRAWLYQKYCNFEIVFRGKSSIIWRIEIINIYLYKRPNEFCWEEFATNLFAIKNYVKLRFSEKATEIWRHLLTSKLFPFKFCGLLRIYELYICISADEWILL